MKKNIIIMIFAVAAIALFSFLIYRTELTDDGTQKACTQEAKICPDGSAVGRSGPNCEFAACPAGNEESAGKMVEVEARLIAEQNCIKDGESLALGYYNENTKTWWFDVNLNTIKEGCNPACVVNEEMKTAEINWRCTGLINQKESVEELQKIFIRKYPKYADTAQVVVDQEAGNYARGSIIFENGAPGGLFLAVKNEGLWKIVFEGNGAPDCVKLRTEYGFPDALLKPNICD